MNAIVDISVTRLAIAYLLLIVPLAIIYVYKVPIFSQVLSATLRMTLQLLFVGFYLQVLFEYNNFWLTLAWIVIMISVADISIVKGTNLNLRRFGLPLFAALVCGTAIPLLLFVGVVLARAHLLDAQYAVPIGGMILGNCMRADIVGLRNFYENIRKQEKVYISYLGQGATLSEATRPFLRESFQASLAPTTATMATVGLVSLPGMMTGVILAGADPVIAIKYQIAIMISIFSSTAITVLLAIWFTMHASFNAYGMLDKKIFTR